MLSKQERVVGVPRAIVAFYMDETCDWVAELECGHQPPAETMLVIVAAVIYFLSPFDLIPDGVPVFGLMDDATVIAGVARANLTAVSNFRKWEVLFSGAFPFPAAESVPVEVNGAVADIVQMVGDKRWGPRLGKTK